MTHDVVPAPKGRGTIVNVAAYQHGVAHTDWQRVNGFSEAIIAWIAASTETTSAPLQASPQPTSPSSVSSFTKSQLLLPPESTRYGVTCAICIAASLDGTSAYLVDCHWSAGEAAAIAVECFLATFTAAGFVAQANHPMSDRRRQIAVQAQDLLDERYVSSAWQGHASQEHSAFVKQRGSPFKIAAAERGGLLSSDVEDLLVTIHLASARGVGVVVDTQRAE